MGRYNSDAEASSFNGLAVISTSFTAGEAIQRGDLVLQGEDGKAYAAAIPSDPPFSLALRPTAGGPAIQNAILTSTIATSSTYAGAGTDSYDVVKLANGNILTSFVDNSGYVGFTLMNQDGDLLVANTLITNVNQPGGAQNAPAVALPGGGFAIAVRTLIGIWLAVFNSSAELAQPTFRVDTSNEVGGIRIALLTSGNIVLVSQQGNTVKYAIYKPDGTQVKASAIVNTADHGASNPRSIGVAALVGGGFVVAYINPYDATSCGAFVQRYDNTGATQGVPATLAVGGNSSIGFVHVVPMSGGGYAAASVSSNSGLHLGIFNAEGAAQGGVHFINRLSVEIYGNNCALAASPTNQVGICYVAQSGSLMTCAVYGANGSLLSEPHSLDSGSCTAVSLSWNADGNAYAVGCFNGTAKLFALSAGLYVASSWSTGYGLPVSFPRMFALGITSTKTNLQSYMLVLQISGPNTPLMVTVGVVARQAMTLMGIATAAAAKGSLVPTQLTGVANVRRAFGQSWATNQQNANPPGQRINVVGNIALLQGVYSANPNPIN